MERRFIGILTKKGGKARARRIFYSVMSYISDESKLSTSEILDEICFKVSPVLDFYRIKKGASVVNYPRLISDQKAKSLAAHWIISSALLRVERTVEDKLKFEILDLLNGQGKAFSKRGEFHKKAVSTRYALKEKSSPNRPHRGSSKVVGTVAKFISRSKSIRER